MTTLDSDAARAELDGLTRTRLELLEIFDEIESTNSYLMQQPQPRPGNVRVAATLNQTAGRGRCGKKWLSPPGSGLCLSVAYTFVRKPENVPALTLAIGLGAIKALKACNVDGVTLKWPNDLVLSGGKLGGILTEAHASSTKAISIVTGIGINIDVAAGFDDKLGPERTLPVADLNACGAALPTHDRIAAHLINSTYSTFAEYEACGFAPFFSRWRVHDWLQGRNVTVDVQQRYLSGVAAGIDNDGALLLDPDDGERLRVVSGSVVAATRVGDSV
jgi:BirA family biotin operon repressor/biotin-[acetyl-CoA-carboxylase] ligase